MGIVRISGRFLHENWSPGGICLQRFPWSNNGIITDTLNELLDTWFSNGTPATEWYLGLISATDFTSLSATDTLADHEGWTEAVNYSGDRPSWSAGDAVGGLKKNATAAAFPITAEEGIIGMFAATDSTKGGTTGTLWATGLFSTGAVTLPVGNTLRLFYEVEMREG